MANKGALTVIISCLLIHFLFALDIPSYVINTASPVSLQVGTNVGFGISLLLFPVFGLLADVCFTRYRMIQAALAILVIVGIAAVIGSGMYVILFQVMRETNEEVQVFILLTRDVIGVLFTIGSIGLYEANAIQFGLDQLQGASSTQLSAFIHWYFWAMHLGQQLVFCIVFVVVFVIQAVLKKRIESFYDLRFIVQTSATVLFLMYLSCVLMESFLLKHAKKYIYIAKVETNVIKRMWKVLTFAWKHQYPLNRSAFTYCEDHTPSRLDFGKEQYGGPFTTEEVEDVKTFFQLLLLLSTLFGYHIAGDGFAVASHMEPFKCPSFIAWALLDFNPTFVSSMVVLISIPFIRCLPNAYKFTPNMLKRIGIGLVFLVVQDLIYAALLALPVLETGVHNQTLHALNSPVEQYMSCYMSETELASIDNTFLWLILPQVFNGLAQVLVNMTLLEFLSAQAPQSLQGLLIGLWYAMFSIRYLVMSSLDHVFTSSSSILIYQSGRCLLVMASFIMYVCVSRTYKYRVRDWVVNVQWIVEDIFDRRMDQEESWREHMADTLIPFDAPSSSPRSDYGSFPRP